VVADLGDAFEVVLLTESPNTLSSLTDVETTTVLLDEGVEVLIVGVLLVVGVGGKQKPHMSGHCFTITEG